MSESTDYLLAPFVTASASMSDVSGEARSAGGQWTAGSGAGGAGAKPSDTPSDGPKKTGESASALPALLAMTSAHISKIVAMSPEEHNAAVDTVDSLNPKELQQLATANNIGNRVKKFKDSDKKKAVKQTIRDRLGIYHRGGY